MGGGLLTSQWEDDTRTSGVCCHEGRKGNLQGQAGTHEMAQIHYLGLEGVGDWFSSLRSAKFQLDPYLRYLNTSRSSLRNKKLNLEWRAASQDEENELNANLVRPPRRRRRGNPKRRHRRRRGDPIPSGVWVFLEDSEECPEKQKRKTEDEFTDAEFIWDDKQCSKESRIKVLETCDDPPALLLDRMPRTEDQEEDEIGKSGRLFLRPNTVPLDRQITALERLLNEPLPSHAPLIRLLTTRSTWPDFERDDLQENEWCILRDVEYDGTDEQRRFVETALETPDFAILEGPPGSGKTTAICELILQAARRGQRILLVASTHVAVDNVLEEIIDWRDRPDSEDLVLPVRIGDENRVESDGVKDFILKNCVQSFLDDLMDFLERPQDVSPEAEPARQYLRDALIKDSRNQSREDFEQFLLDGANLVCGTTIGILKHPAMRNGVEPFDMMILDEASKTTFSEFLVPALHARKWIIVGDIKQLAPYIDDGEFSSNLQEMLSEEDAQICMNTFAAEKGDYGKPMPVLVATDSDQEKQKYLDQANENGVPVANLDEPLEMQPLYASLMVGKPESIAKCEARLPGDLRILNGPLPSLPTFERHRAAMRVESPEEEQDWSEELAWRLIRAYELRQDGVSRERYDDDIEALIPVWDEVNRKIKDDLRYLRRVGLPSILELLQVGFEPYEGQRNEVVLTHGLPGCAKKKRLASLKYQHRMHPDISRFSREQFYSYDGKVLLQDSRKAIGRDWGYDRYPMTAAWVNVEGHQLSGNRNEIEADRLKYELDEFLIWAHQNPPAEDGPFDGTYEVAVLTFYRGQEAVLREHLQRKFGQRNKRNFYVQREGEKDAAPLVHVTLCTVDRFQGHEADIVFLSFVKTRSVGFLNSPNRINVALTRARYQLVLLGDRGNFRRQQGSELLQQLAENITTRDDIEWRPQR